MLIKTPPRMSELKATQVNYRFRVVTHDGTKRRSKNVRNLWQAGQHILRKKNGFIAAAVFRLNGDGTWTEAETPTY